MAENADQSSITSRLAAALGPDESFGPEADTPPMWQLPRSLSTPADYCLFVEWLRKPSRRVITAATHFELLCPHTPPDDYDFPVPVDEVQRARLLLRLPHRQKVICALTAAEMALPVWFARAALGQTTMYDAEKVLACVRMWLAGRMDNDDLMRSRHVPWDENFKGVPRDAVLMAVASAAAAARVAVLDDPSDVERALTFAADACDIGMYWSQFLTDWWRHCRCRMPFRDAITAELM